MKLRWLFGVGFMVCVNGCANPTGTWSLEKVEPEGSPPGVEFERIRLEKDGTFFVQQEPGEAAASGIYDYDRKKDSLVLHSHDGQALAYDARIRGGEMEIETYWQGRNVKAEFKRIEGPY